ncbi:MAG: MarR family winged helix-turn-helix transcriptional regulator [Pseudomonadales bacterium]
MTSVESPSPYADPLQSIGYLCRINFRMFARELERRIARHGVSSGQWRSLRVLWAEDDITQRELSQRVGATEATTVPIIRSLIRDGFVTRTPHPDDRRKVRIRLTPKARRLEQKLMPYVAEVNEMAMRGLSAEDCATTRRVLARMYANLAEPGC